MNQEDLNRIESELQIQLPEIYRSFMATIEDQELIGNQDCDFWDDANAIIARNKGLREGTYLNKINIWPPDLFFIGDPLDCCANAIDLADERFPVLWIDHYDLAAKSSGIVSTSFHEWATDIIEGMY